ncbi:MAG: hypothetical protein ACYDBV_00875 [Nitrospiria bacterium]
MFAPKLAYIIVVLTSFILWFYFNHQGKKKEKKEKKEILQKGLESAIQYYLQKGFRIIRQTDDSVQLLKPKEFSFPIALLGLFLFFIGFIIYMLIYLNEKDETVYLTVGTDGKMKEKRG